MSRPLESLTLEGSCGPRVEGYHRSYIMIGHMERPGLSGVMKLGRRMDGYGSSSKWRYQAPSVLQPLEQIGED